MAVGLIATLKMVLAGTLTNSTSGGTDTFSKVITDTFTSGTSANQATREWEDDRTLTTGATENIDLFDFGTLDIGGGAGLDSLGQALALTGIKGLLIQNSASSGGNLLIGGEGSAGAWNTLFNGVDTSVIKLPAGASIMVSIPTASGLAVADTSNHLLKMANDSGGCTYTVHLIGI